MIHPLQPERPERVKSVDVRSMGRAPRWSMLALQRESVVLQRRGRLPPEQGLARRVLVPAAVGAATVVGLVALGGLVVALALVVAVTTVFAVIARLEVTQRWCERQRLVQLDHEALRLRSRLVSRLHREHRDELECLVALVENIRDHEASRTNPARAPSTLMTRLDALLLSYVERAIEVRGVAAGFAVTLDDEPRLVDSVAAMGSEAGFEAGFEAANEPDQRRALQILHLRRRARAMCRRRIDRMERELACIGQLVRLVHEQALASGLTHDELSGLLADVLDEAEHAREAREEVESALAEARRSVSTMSPAAASVG